MAIFAGITLVIQIAKLSNENKNNPRIFWKV